MKQGFISRFTFSVLRDIPEARDNWMLVVKLIHDTEMTIKKIEKREYYSNFFNNKFSNIDTIKRVWALIQEKNPKLRGEKWEERQRMSKQVSREIVSNQLNLF
jgi:hypothetical protein